MLKLTIAFVVGAAIGAASTYFALRGRTEAEIERECEELRLYYRDKEQKERDRIVKEAETALGKDILPVEVDGYMDPDKKKEMEAAYERLRSVEYPEDDDEYEENGDGEYTKKEPKPVSPPRLVKEEDWQTCPTFDKVNLYYYTEDDTLTNEDEEIIDDPRYYIGDALTKFDFKHNDEKVIYVRNEEIGTDFEIEKIWGEFHYR